MTEVEADVPSDLTFEDVVDEINKEKIEV